MPRSVMVVSFAGFIAPRLLFQRKRLKWTISIARDAGFVLPNVPQVL